jgi:hypothetical protein
MKIGLVLTNDWELFGDGSGDFFDIQYDPLMKLLPALEQYGAKLTIMAEIGQQWAYKELAKNDKKADKIANTWEDAILKTISRGHDVQLHYHPQWYGANYTDQKWYLNMDQVVLASLGKEKIDEIIKNGKEYLEFLLKPVAPDYKCKAFRAGAYCIQPSENVIRSLIENGIKCDTSVTKGLYNEGLYDFRRAPHNFIPWSIERDVNSISKNKHEIIELPIYSFDKLVSEALRKFYPKIFYRLFYGNAISNSSIEWIKERDYRKAVLYPVKNRFYKKSEKRSIFWYFRKIISKSSVQLDYDYIPAEIFVGIIEKIYKNINNKFQQKTDIFPIICSGHIKDMPNINNISTILKLISDSMSNEVEFITLSEAIDIIFDNKLYLH